jgi:hypothetical protein
MRCVRINRSGQSTTSRRIVKRLEEEILRQGCASKGEPACRRELRSFPTSLATSPWPSSRQDETRMGLSPSWVSAIPCAGAVGVAPFTEKPRGFFLLPIFESVGVYTSGVRVTLGHPPERRFPDQQASPSDLGQRAEKNRTDIPHR